MSGPIIWGAPQWLIPAALLCIAIVAGLLLGYRRNLVGWAARTAPLLKTIGVVALAICLIEPLINGVRPRPGANLFLVLVDNSESLQLRSPNMADSSAEQLRRWLHAEADWHARLAQDFDVRRYAFDDRLHSRDDLHKLDFHGISTSLGESLRTIAERFRDRPVAGVLLFTDGNATDEVVATGLPPVFPVVLGSDADARDICVENVSATYSNFQSAPVVIQATILASGYDGRSITVQLRDEENRFIEQQSAKATREPLRVQFRFRPEQAGISFYQVSAFLSEEAPAEKIDDKKLNDSQQRTSEATLVNNSRLVLVEQLQGPYRVLYVGGRPNWEFKFLRRSIEQDEELEIVGLIRIANREPKFDFRGRAGESSNPLFRGFDQQDPEEVERYDQPVLVRLGVESAEELRDGFPKAMDRLYPFHAIILDDVESSFLSADQMSLLEQFVSERGGGLLMLGGAESFVQGGYDRTPIGDLLPVYTSNVDEQIVSGGGDEGEFRLELTREGWLQPWLRLRGTEEEEVRRLDELPLFRTRNRVGAAKPGASVLVMATDRQDQSAPALVVQRFGKGRTAALTIGDLWRWGIRQTDPKGREDFQHQWMQLLRWLVTDVPRRVEVQSEFLNDEPHQPVEISIKLRDESFEPLDNAHVHVRITGPNNTAIELMAEASTESAGTYQCRYLPREQGAYRATVKAVAPDAQELEQRTTGWVYEPANVECRTLRPNRMLLSRVAKESGGELLELDDLNRFVSGLPNRKVPITEPWIYPLWHRWPVFVLALFCLVGEWGLRRWRGLP